jgi:hypothetical protein
MGRACDQHGGGGARAAAHDPHRTAGPHWPVRRSEEHRVTNPCVAQCRPGSLHSPPNEAAANTMNHNAVRKNDLGQHLAPEPSRRAARLEAARSSLHCETPPRLNTQDLTENQPGGAPGRSSKSGWWNRSSSRKSPSTCPWTRRGGGGTQSGSCACAPISRPPRPPVRGGELRGVPA